MDDLQHHGGAVAGLAGGRVLDLALELRIEQVGEGFRRRVELGGVVDEVLVVADHRLVGIVPAVDLIGRGRLELLQQALGLGALDERRQGDENVGLRVRLLLGDALDDAARAGLDILHLDAGRLGEGVELGLEPAALAVVQAIGGIDGDDVGSGESWRGDDDGRAGEQSAD